MKKIFRKYPNRRLYDVEKKEYVNLDDIKKDILNLIAVEVIDVKTQEDITNGILLQIINKQDTESKHKVVTAQALTSLIMLYESPFSVAVSHYLESFLSWMHLANPMQNAGVSNADAATLQANSGTVDPAASSPVGMAPFLNWMNPMGMYNQLFFPPPGMMPSGSPPSAQNMQAQFESMQKAWLEQMAKSKPGE